MNIRTFSKNILLQKIMTFLRGCKYGNYNYFLLLFPVKSNKIVVSNFYGKGYGDNGKYITENLLSRGVNCDIVWLYKTHNQHEVNFPKGVRVVKYGSLKSLFELSTSKIWIDNCRKMYSPPKRGNQVYIQTWHGSIALKRIERDIEEKLSTNYRNDAIRDSMMADYFISNSEFSTNMYKTAFWYEGEILKYGSPRCDILYNRNENSLEKIKDYFKINRETHILMYAPTFRNDANSDIYSVNFNELIDVVKAKWGGDWIVLVRLHPNISNEDKFLEYNSRIINATHYDDMYELLAVSDVLVTDYSSTMFEFSFTYKPVFLYAPDIEEYVAERNFYFEIDRLPFSLSLNNEELFDAIKQFDEEIYLKKIHDFESKVGLYEKGDASYQVANKIKQIISNE